VAKQKSAQEQYKEKLALQEHSSSQLKEWFPEINKLTILITFKDLTDLESPEQETHLFLPERKAFFLFHCPYRECVNGGFDLTQDVKNAVAAINKTTLGKIECLGWQDEQRIGAHRCKLTASYKIAAE
jgi:hypothetical protein